MYYPHCWITADLLWWTGWDMYYPHWWITADLLILVDRLRYVLPSLLDHSRSTHLGGQVEICTTLTVGSQQIYCGGPVEICTILTGGSQQIYSSWWTGWDMYYPHWWITADLLILVDRLRYVLPSLLDHSRSTHLGGQVEICTTLTVGSQQIYSSWWTGWDMYYPHCWITADLLILVDRLRYVLPSLLDHSRSTHLGGQVEICTTLTVGSQQIYSSWWTGWDMYYPHCWITADLLWWTVEICTTLTVGSQQIYSSWWTSWDMYYPHCWITADLLILVDRLRYVLPSLLDHSRSTVVDRLRYVLSSLVDHSRSTHLGGPIEICKTLTVGSQQIYSSWWTGWDMYYPHWWITADLLILVDRLRYVLPSLLDHSRSTHLGGLVEICTILTGGSQQIYSSWWTGWDMYYPHCWITADLLILVDRLRYVLPSLLDHRSTHLGGPVEICTTLTVGSQQIYSSWWTGWDMYYPHCWITDLLILVDRLRYVLPSLLDHSRSTVVDRLRYVLPSLLDHSRSTHLGGLVEICTILTGGSQQIYSSWWTGWDMYYPHCWITADLLILVDRLRYVLPSLLDHRSTHLGGPVEICTTLTVGSQQIYCGGPVEICTTLTVGSQQIYSSWWTGWDMYYPHCWITADLLILVDRLRYVLPSLLDHCRSTHLGGPVEICTTLTFGLRYVLPSLLDHSRSTLGGQVEICTILTVGSQQIYSSWWTGWDMYYPLLDHSRSTLGGPVEICTILTGGSQIYSWWTGWDMYYPHWWISHIKDPLLPVRFGTYGNEPQR